MKTPFTLLLLTFLFLSASYSVDSVAVRTCSSVAALQEKMALDPEIAARRATLDMAAQKWLEDNSSQRLSNSIITIPCVIFNLYHDSLDSLSYEQLTSQIAALNKDFSNSNADRLSSSHPYFSSMGNTTLQFCLAERDPDGQATSGIIRQKVTNTFANKDHIKYSKEGGLDGWPSDKYLNIWVTKVNDATFLGQADFPGIYAEGSVHDGLIVQYNAFGTVGTLDGTFNKGRTATHEIGHWLNLNHIWGDEYCGDDKVSDTPVQEKENYGCPAFPHITCSNTPNGDMFMNFMDYVDDACMVMFTQGQANRMLATLNNSRSGILSSGKCSGTTSIGQNGSSGWRIYPNPAQNYLYIEGLPVAGHPYFTVDFYTAMGQQVHTLQLRAGENMLEMPALPNGTYALHIHHGNFAGTHKVSITQ